MADKKIFRIKKEKTNGITSATESMFLQDPFANINPCVDMKEEPGLNFDTGSSEDNFCQGQLSIDNPCVDMKEEPELNLDACGLEHNDVEDQSIISESNESITEDVELNLEAEETENFADTNLQQFEVDHLEDSVKHKQDGGAATLPPQQQHPPTMLLLQPSPPHHLLTPPGKDTLSLYGPGQQRASEYPKEVERHRAEPELVARQHLATPPDTPPVSLSPTQLVSTTAMVAAGALLEDVSLSAVNYLAQEEHDLHSICTANNMMEPLGAPMLVAASGTTEAISSIANNCCNLSVDDASHHNLLHHYCEEQVPVQPLDAGPVLHTAHQSHRRQHHREPAPPQHITSTASSSKVIINDDALVSLPMSELNFKLGGFPREVVVRLKQKRRALKNLGYAKNRQSKWVQKRRDLEITNRTLVAELKHVKTELVRISKERDLYKRYLEHELCATIHTPRSDTASSSTTMSPPDTLGVQDVVNS